MRASAHPCLLKPWLRQMLCHCASTPRTPRPTCGAYGAFTSMASWFPYSWANGGDIQVPFSRRCLFRLTAPGLHPLLHGVTLRGVPAVAYIWAPPGSVLSLEALCTLVCTQFGSPFWMLRSLSLPRLPDTHFFFHSSLGVPSLSFMESLWVSLFFFLQLLAITFLLAKICLPVLIPVLSSPTSTCYLSSPSPLPYFCHLCC